MIIKNVNWTNCYESIIGKSHIKAKTKNQDSVLSKVISENIMVSAIADGHGSKKCFRSDLGAKFAVESAVEVIESIKQELIINDNKLNTKALGKFYTKKIISLWKEKIKNHIDNNPIDFKNITDITKSGIKSLEKNNTIVYGSTLLIVLLIHDYIICYQLGDGDIMLVSKAKKVSKPIKRDERHIANETSSLCVTNPENEFRIKMFRDLNHYLKMIILSTDGYSNSFSSDKDFLKVGYDLIDMLDSDGIEIIEENLKAWIDDTSFNGSGDDTSVSIITRIDSSSQ